MLIKDRCADTEPAERLITLTVLALGRGMRSRGESMSEDRGDEIRRKSREEMIKRNSQNITQQERGKSREYSSCLTTSTVFFKHITDKNASEK